MNMRGNAQGSINQYLADTISSVFSEVYTVDVYGSTNRELFASDNPRMIENMNTNSIRIADERLYAMMKNVEENLAVYEAGTYIMTDDKAPVELLGMRVIDELIRDEITYYRNIYEQQGVDGLLDFIF